MQFRFKRLAVRLHHVAACRPPAGLFFFFEFKARKASRERGMGRNKTIRDRLENLWFHFPRAQAAISVRIFGPARERERESSPGFWCSLRRRSLPSWASCALLRSPLDERDTTCVYVCVYVYLHVVYIYMYMLIHVYTYTRHTYSACTCDF